jgi:hypothetical protein
MTDLTVEAERIAKAIEHLADALFAIANAIDRGLVIRQADYEDGAPWHVDVRVKEMP